MSIPLSGGDAAVAARRCGRACHGKARSHGDGNEGTALWNRQGQDSTHDKGGASRRHATLGHHHCCEVRCRCEGRHGTTEATDRKKARGRRVQVAPFDVAGKHLRGEASGGVDGTGTCYTHGTIVTE
jgi:hypothetical protein